jgi:hypothetical protein
MKVVIPGLGKCSMPWCVAQMAQVFPHIIYIFFRDVDGFTSRNNPGWLCGTIASDGFTMQVFCSYFLVQNRLEEYNIAAMR